MTIRSLIFVLLSACNWSLGANEPVWMTVFIHGAVKPQWTRCSFLKVMRDSVDHSTYEKAVHSLRNDPFFYRLHAMQGLGLKPIELDTKQYTSGAQAVAQVYDAITARAESEKTLNYYYTFG